MNCILPKYRPSDTEFLELWEKCIFIPDTSLLLGLFRYSPELRESIIGVFEKVPGRLWIPYQVAIEYYNNWENVIDEEVKKYNTITGIINECSKNINTQLNKKDLFKKYEATSEITKALTNKINESIKKELDDVKELYPKRETFNEIDNKINKLFEGNVGEPYSIEKLQEIAKIGSARYELNIPPGYEDEGKGGIKSYGDLIIWFQTMEMAKKVKRPIILILDDLKEDWWWTASGKIMGPRPELIHEFTSQSDVLFYMYTMDQFLRYAKGYIDTKIKQEVIEEAQEYRADEEKRRKELSRHLIELQSLAIIDELGEFGKKQEELSKKLEALTKIPDYSAGIASFMKPQEDLSKKLEALTKIPDYSAGIASFMKPQEDLSKKLEALTKIPDYSAGIASFMKPQEDLSKKLEALTKIPDYSAGIASFMKPQEDLSKKLEALTKIPDYSAGIVSSMKPQEDLSKKLEALTKIPDYSAGIVSSMKQQEDLSKKLEALTKIPDYSGGIASAVKQLDAISTLPDLPTSKGTKNEVKNKKESNEEEKDG